MCKSVLRIDSGGYEIISISISIVCFGGKISMKNVPIQLRKLCGRQKKKPITTNK
jgi:hypothetical protein